MATKLSSYMPYIALGLMSLGALSCVFSMSLILWIGGRFSLVALIGPVLGIFFTLTGLRRIAPTTQFPQYAWISWVIIAAAVTGIGIAVKHRLA